MEGLFPPSIMKDGFVGYRNPGWQYFPSEVKIHYSSIFLLKFLVRNLLLF
jgi:hypothetical protein